MVDIEKVIKGLECCLTKPEHNCEECPYEGEGEGGWPCKSPEMKADALELLKERKMGKYVSCKVKTPTGKWNGEKCSVCGSEYIGSAPCKWNYCPDCGAKMENNAD